MTEPVTVRPATPDDAAFAVPLIQETIGHIGLILTGAASDAEAEGVMLAFFARPGNRLSFQNVWIAQRDGETLGLLLGYAGAAAAALDEPFRAHLRERGLPDDFPPRASPASGTWTPWRSPKRRGGMASAPGCCRRHRHRPPHKGWSKWGCWWNTATAPPGCTSARASWWRENGNWAGTAITT